MSTVMRIPNKAFLFIFLIAFIGLMEPTPASSGQTIIDSNNQFEFALQLMGRGEYQSAVGEFERFIHFFPDDEKVPRAHYLIGVCYLEASAYESAREAFEEVYHSYFKRPLGGKALLLIGESYYKQGISEKADDYFEKVIEDYPDLRNAALYRLGWVRMRADQWHEASEAFSGVEPRSPLYASSQELAEKSLQGEHLPYRDPATAGIMAAIVPGLGHAYCNRNKEAIVAFILNGLFIWAAVESFNEGHNSLGVILTLAELGWYTGNIYSAVSSAHKYNRKAKDDFRRSLPDRFNLNLFTSREGHLGLALKIEF